MIDNKFPTIGEVYNFFIDALGVLDFVKSDKKNSITKDIERLIKEKSIDVENFIVIENEIINVLKEIIPNNDIMEIVIRFPYAVISEYLEQNTPNLFKTKEDVYNFLILNFGYVFVLKANLLKYIFLSKKSYFPNDKNWFIPEVKNNEVIYPIEKVIKWWMELVGIKTLKEFAEKINGKETELQNSSFQKNLQRWFSNDNIIKTDMINEICKIEFGIKEEKTFKKYLKLNLIIAKLVGFVSKKIQIFSKTELDYQALLSIYMKYNFQSNNDISNIYNNFNSNSDFKKIDSIEKLEFILSFYSENIKVDLKEEYLKYKISQDTLYLEDLAVLLDKECCLRKEKQLGDIETAKRKIEVFEENKEQTSTYYSFLCWIKARFYVLQNNSEEAIKWYKEAYESGKYCTGKIFIEILREYIVLACELKDVKTVKNLYKIAYYFGLYTEKYEEVKDYFIEYTSRKFEATFNKKYFYKEVMKNIETEDKLSNIVITDDYLKYFENLYKNATEKNVNKLIDDISVKGKKTTLLVMYSELRDVEKVKHLLSLGADVNICSSSNDHPLMVAIQTNKGIIHKEKESKETALLILDNDNLKKETINTVTKRKKISALHEAAYRGEVEIVKKIIEKGGDINLKASLDNVTPLNYMLGLINLVYKQNLFYNESEEGTIKAIKHIDLSYYNSPNLFDHEFLGHKDNPEAKKLVTELYFKMYLGKYDKYIEIIDLLLEKGANVNEKYTNGFTPFIFTSEIGNLELFKKFLNKGGNIFDTNDFNDNVLIQSISFGSFEIAEYILDYIYELSQEKDISQIINAQKTNNKRTPLHVLYLIQRNSPLFSSLFDKLLLLNPDLTLKDSFGKTVFEYAFEYKDNFVINKFAKKQ